MTEYVFHIGPHKTGSTYLQDSFCKLREELAQKGIIYPTEWQSFLTGHHALATELRQRNIDLLQSGFHQLPKEGVIVFSSEEFSLLDQSALALLKELTGPNKVRIVFYARRWSELLPSCWQEDIKQGATDTLPEYYLPRLADPISSSTLNFNIVLDRFASIFGPETISIVSYSNLQDNNTDLFKHFLTEVLKISVNDFSLPAPSFPNVSLEYFDIEIIRMLNILDHKMKFARGPQIRSLYLRKKAQIDLRTVAEFMAANLARISIDDGAYALNCLFSIINEKYQQNVIGGDKKIFAQAKGKPSVYVRAGYLLSEKVVDELHRIHSKIREVDVSIPNGGTTAIASPSSGRMRIQFDLIRLAALLIVLVLFSICVGQGPVDQARAAEEMSVWFAPNNDSPDLVAMFQEPQAWVGARSLIKVFKFGPQQVGGGNPTGVNTIADLSKVGAFKLLQSWGIQIAIESPAIKPWDCTGKVAAVTTLKLVKNINSSGGETRFVSLDEPLVAGIRYCHDDLVSAASKTAAYIKIIKSAAPNLIIGDIEPYPWYSPAQLKSWIEALEKDGVKLAFLHLDVNVHSLDAHVRPNINVGSDLRAIRDYLNSKQIRFGIIFWSGYNPVHSDKAYYDRVMSWVIRVRSAIGTPGQAIFQSWVTRSSMSCSDTSPSCTPASPKCTNTDPTYCGQKSVPINLPDNSSEVYSHTRLVIDATRILKQKN